MILAGIFNKLVTNELMLNQIFQYDEARDAFLRVIRTDLSESFLEDPEYNASSTNSREILKLIVNVFEDLSFNQFTFLK